MEIIVPSLAIKLRSIEENGKIIQFLNPRIELTIKHVIYVYIEATDSLESQIQSYLFSKNQATKG